jgi:hypothetical protein
LQVVSSRYVCEGFDSNPVFPSKHSIFQTITLGEDRWFVNKRGYSPIEI